MKLMFNNICRWMLFRHHVLQAQAGRMNGYLGDTKEPMWGRQPPKRDQLLRHLWPFPRQPKETKPCYSPGKHLSHYPSLQPELLPQAPSLSIYGQIVGRASWWVFLAPNSNPLCSSCVVLTRELSLNTTSPRTYRGSNLNHSAWLSKSTLYLAPGNTSDFLPWLHLPFLTGLFPCIQNAPPRSWLCSLACWGCHFYHLTRWLCATIPHPFPQAPGEPPSYGWDCWLFLDIRSLFFHSDTRLAVTMATQSKDHTSQSLVAGLGPISMFTHEQVWDNLWILFLTKGHALSLPHLWLESRQAVSSLGWVDVPT